MTRTILAAATAAATAALIAATGAAQAQQVELVTGVGFGHSKVEAQVQAVRAWINQSVRDYGDPNWNDAMRTQMKCFEDGGSGFGTLGIGVEGDVSGKWSCTVTGLPLAALG